MIRESLVNSSMLYFLYLFKNIFFNMYIHTRVRMVPQKPRAGPAVHVGRQINHATRTDKLFLVVVLRPSSRFVRARALRIRVWVLLFLNFFTLHVTLPLPRLIELRARCPLYTRTQARPNKTSPDI
jgi:hypothetical protein